MPHHSCAGTWGPQERKEPWGSRLTDEPDSLLPQGLLGAFQVQLAHAHIVPVVVLFLGQLEREGHQAGAELPLVGPYPRPGSPSFPPAEHSQRPAVQHQGLE